MHRQSINHIFSMGLWASIALTTKLEAHVQTLNSRSHLRVTKIKASRYSNSTVPYLTFQGQRKNLKFSQYLGDCAIIKAKLQIKQLGNQAMPFKTCMSFKVFGGSILTIAKIFFGFGILPSLDKIYLKMTLKYTMHFSSLKLLLKSLHLSKHNQSLSSCILKSLNTLKSSRNNFLNTMNPKIALKGHIHFMLVCHWNILQSKLQHDNPHKCSPICNESNFAQVF